MRVEHTAALLSVLGILALAAAACDKSSQDEKPRVEAPETEKESPAEPGADEGSEESGKSAESGPPESLDELPEGVNAAQYEMQLLDEAMRNTLTLIANDELGKIPGEIKKVHPARQLTEKALNEGKYRPPQNPDKMEAFAEQDAQFHEDLKGLLKAAKKDDLQKATEQYGKLVSGCTDCHTKFRFK